MSFNRFRVQRYIENALGCADLGHWHSYRARVEGYSLPRLEEDVLKQAILSDGEDLFYKGLVSLGEGLSEVAEGRHSWATVKLYYSVFYFLRASLAARGYSIIKNQSLYLFRIAAGSSPSKRSSTRFRNDHIGIINIYTDIVGDGDILQTNSIGGVSVYNWLMECRHQVHYRQRDFLEPEYLEEFHQARDAITSGSFSDLLCQYFDDSLPIYCFDADHAIIAAPIKRAMLTRIDLCGTVMNGFSAAKLNAAKHRLGSFLPSSSSVWNLFDENC